MQGRMQLIGGSIKHRQVGYGHSMWHRTTASPFRYERALFKEMERIEKALQCHYRSSLWCLQALGELFFTQHGRQVPSSPCCSTHSTTTHLHPNPLPLTVKSCYWVWTSIACMTCFINLVYSCIWKHKANDSNVTSPIKIILSLAWLMLSLICRRNFCFFLRSRPCTSLSRNRYSCRPQCCLERPVSEIFDPIPVYPSLPQDPLSPAKLGLLMKADPLWYTHFPFFLVYSMRHIRPPPPFTKLPASSAHFGKCLVNFWLMITPFLFTPRS